MRMVIQSLTLWVQIPVLHSLALCSLSFLGHISHICQEVIKTVSTFHVVVRPKAFIGDGRAHRMVPGM